MLNTTMRQFKFYFKFFVLCLLFSVRQIYLRSLLRCPVMSPGFGARRGTKLG